MEKVCCYFDERVHLWSELEVLEEEGCIMFVPEELLVKVGSVFCTLSCRK
jgi:hypothetical protein